MHVIQTIANNTSVPYFTWFAERMKNYPDVTFSFVALCPEKPIMINELKKYNCHTYWIKFDHRRRKWGMIFAFFKLYRLFRKLKPDVIHTHMFDDALPCLLAARVADVKLRVIQKEDTAFHWNYKPIWVWADRFNNYNSTHIIAISGESKKFILEKEKAAPSKVSMIHNGIDLKSIRHHDENIKNILREKYNPQMKILIVTIARYIEWKGYRYIIEAAKSIVEKNKNVKFLFVGYGGQEQELLDLISHHRLNEFIEIAGWIDRKDIPSLYGIMDIYLHAAYMEPFGFVIAEAMANGVPIVTTNTGIAADALVHKESCFFAESKSSKSIAEGITWMIEHPKEREGMREKVKQIADEKLGVDLMLEDFIKLYKGLPVNQQI